ncbi:hypothetical protein SAMN05421759_11833 [Roseivivax lentus]|uniref:Uncharacterized protein n=2 Tax=Roseivivax lentus TaxID=633194 RepID=A0A1N7PP79_9RHOB|nr:hypothetical protein SAMN05421759_11833 [Roseivivax lentus]
MPEDCMLSFVFATSDNDPLGVASPTASLAARDQILDVIENFRGFDVPGNRLGNGPDAVTAAAEKKLGRFDVPEPFGEETVPADVGNAPDFDWSWHLG